MDNPRDDQPQEKDSQEKEELTPFVLPAWKLRHWDEYNAARQRYDDAQRKAKKTINTGVSLFYGGLALIRAGYVTVRPEYKVLAAALDDIDIKNYSNPDLPTEIIAQINAYVAIPLVNAVNDPLPGYGKG